MNSIQSAMEKIGEAREAAEKCTLRPKYHFLAPANWMNDPNGTLFYKGEYHLFYQLNPYKNKWGSIHWGHAKSRDLVHWEHLPIALLPSREKGERHCFSGCCLDDDGRPTILYTKIGSIRDVFTGAEQWLVRGDENLRQWIKCEDNPVMDDSLHGNLKVRQWRDPYIWKQNNNWYCVLGGHFRWKHKGVVLLYRSKDLKKWEYMHPLYEGFKGQGWAFECPNFFQIGNKYMLILSPFGKVIYGLGKYDEFKFLPESWHLMDHGRCYYATNTLFDDKERIILFGWIKGGGKGWNGCMSLPRVLGLDDKGQVTMKPVKELEALRGQSIHHDDLTLIPGSDKIVDNLGSSCLEILAKFQASGNEKFGFKILGSKKDVNIGVDMKKNVIFAGKEKGRVENLGKSLKLHIFLDKSVIEVFLNDKECITSHFYLKESSLKIHAFSNRGNVKLKSLDIWRLNTI